MSIVSDIKDLLNEGVAKGHFPGAHFGIIYKDRNPLFSYTGYKQVQPTLQKLLGNEIYDIASLTKVISTTTLIMKLVEKGQLHLTTKVSDILPQFKHEQITIEHLLTHTSGLPADLKNANTLQSKEDVKRKIYSLDLIHSLGEKIVYSDIGFLLLGFIVEQITKQPLSIIAKQWIFDPLQMNDTSYHPDPHRCAPTEYRNDTVYKGYLQGLVHDEKAFALGNEAGHAGLFSTTKDIAAFLSMYLEGKETILKKETQDNIFIARVEDINQYGHKIIRAYGFDKPTNHSTAGDYIDFQETILHTGFTGCNLWMDRSKGIGFVLLSNGVHPNRTKNNIKQYRHKIANMILKEYEENKNEKNT